MTSEHIQAIATGGRFPGPKTPATLIETHISWVILTPAFAFKIKKPLRLPFLDFSTPEKRAFFCREEIRLNRRLAPDMYIEVLPVSLAADGLPEICLAGCGGTPVDTAVSMKRMDDSRQMDRLLHRNAVTSGDMEALAAKLADFHRSVVMDAAATAGKQGGDLADFSDLFRLADIAGRLWSDAAAQFDAWRRQVEDFLDKHEARMQQRARSGFWVDGHGDLHARNIFLLPEGPVVFDCIEFNPHFRQVDVLSELAFLCMDLDAGGHHELAEIFMAAYGRRWPCIESLEDERLFLYYKAYRANVRLKVGLMEMEQHPAPAIADTARTYWTLLKTYLLRLETGAVA